MPMATQATDLLIAPRAAAPHRTATDTFARFADKALKAAAASWLVVAMAGQWIMATYVGLLYGGIVAGTRPETWNAVMAHGHVPGEPVLNGVVMGHVAFAFVVLVGGSLQLVPAIRRRWPALHRWNGRLYLAAVALMCVGGMAMQLTRAALQSGVFTSALTINVVLTAVFAWRAYRDARARRFDAHRRWAMRLFVVAGAQWFFRIALMLWIVVNQGPVGFDPETFRGPTTSILAYAQFLLPWAVLELYFRAQAAGPRAKLAMAGGLGLMTLATAGGIAAASLILWVPRM
jgi:hypothetical protein